MAYLTKAKLKKMGFKKLGSNVRISDKASIYNCDRIEIGDNSRIDDFCVISGRVVIGKHVHIAPLCLIAGGLNGVFLADFCGLSYRVQVFSQSDDYSGETLTNPTVPAKYKNETKTSVTIGRHVIIGANAIVLPGVHVMDGCAISAMTLINKNTSPWGIYAGIPGRRLKDRKMDLLELEAQLLAEESHAGF